MTACKASIYNYSMSLVQVVLCVIALSVPDVGLVQSSISSIAIVSASMVNYWWR